MRPVASKILAIALAVLGLPTLAWAGAFSVVPQSINLAPTNPSGMVEVRNNADVETVFQIETFAWTDSPALEDLSPTREILAVPAVFRLAPGATQTIRVAARGPALPENIERSYRLLVSEVPNDEQAGGVVFALRMSLPVFLTPPGVQGRVAFELLPDGRQVRLRNPGRAHLRLSEVRVVDQTSGNVLEKLNLPQPAYLLPERNLVLPISANMRQWNIRFEADTTGGRFQYAVGE